MEIKTTSAQPNYFSTNLVDGKDAQDPAKVGGMFESIFYRMILDNVRKSSEEDDPFMEGHDSQQMRAMADDQMADRLGQQGLLGISKWIEEHSGSARQATGLVKGTEHGA